MIYLDKVGFKTRSTSIIFLKKILIKKALLLKKSFHNSYIS